MIQTNTPNHKELNEKFEKKTIVNSEHTKHTHTQKQKQQLPTRRIFAIRSKPDPLM